MSIRISKEQAEDFAKRACMAVGMPEGDAAITASMLVETEMRGVRTHGLARLGPWYVRCVRQGIYKADPAIRILRETASCAHIDADKSMGFALGARAMEIAMQKAALTGVGLVAAENVGHFGASFNYPLLASRKGMIGFCCTNTPPWMAAPGTTDAAIGTNPLAFAAPITGHADFLLDMSCTVVAAAKALREGFTNPEGWVIDSEGRPVTDPKKVGMGISALLPLGSDPEHGSYKGFGLGIAVEILTAILTGTECGKLNLEGGHHSNCSFFAAVSIEAFVDRAVFDEKMSHLADMLESLPHLLRGVEKLYMPGSHSEELYERCLRDGIELSDEVVQDHRALAEELGIEIDY